MYDTRTDQQVRDQLVLVMTSDSDGFHVEEI